MDFPTHVSVFVEYLSLANPKYGFLWVHGFTVSKCSCNWSSAILMNVLCVCECECVVRVWYPGVVLLFWLYLSLSLSFFLDILPGHSALPPRSSKNKWILDIRSVQATPWMKDMPWVDDTARPAMPCLRCFKAICNGLTGCAVIFSFLDRILYRSPCFQKVFYIWFWGQKSDCGLNPKHKN